MSFVFHFFFCLTVFHINGFFFLNLVSFLQDGCVCRWASWQWWEIQLRLKIIKKIVSWRWFCWTLQMYKLMHGFKDRCFPMKEKLLLLKSWVEKKKEKWIWSWAADIIDFCWSSLLFWLLTLRFRKFTIDKMIDQFINFVIRPPRYLFVH